MTFFQSLVVERIRRYGSYSSAEHVSVVRTAVAQIDSSSLHCLVDRACGSEKGSRS